MTYKIEYADGKCCNFAYSHKDLIDWLYLLRDETITDIKKMYRNGTSVSVMDKYRKHMKEENKK